MATHVLACMPACMLACMPARLPVCMPARMFLHTCAHACGRVCASTRATQGCALKSMNNVSIAASKPPSLAARAVYFVSPAPSGRRVHVMRKILLVIKHHKHLDSFNM
eukprot:6188459-Pleurochrysis_carterae.AAC.4